MGLQLTRKALQAICTLGSLRQSTGTHLLLHVLEFTSGFLQASRQIAILTLEHVLRELGLVHDAVRAPARETTGKRGVLILVIEALILPSIDTIDGQPRVLL